MSKVMTIEESIIRKNPLFSDLFDEEWAMVKASLRPLKVPKGEIIFTEGEDAHGFYLVEKGKVKVFKLSPEGKEQIIRIFSAGEHFAEAAVFSGKKFPAHSAALTDSTLVYLPAVEFRNLIEKSPRIAMRMLGALSRYMHHLVSVVEELSLKEVPSRFARFLLEKTVSSSASPEGFREVSLPFTKGELALSLGTTSETLSRILKKMKTMEIISEKGKKIILLREDKLLDIIRGEKI